MMGSGYIVYVDESGDHSLTSIDADYPMFVLAFCIFPVDCYVDRVVPLVQRIKFDFFGHDMVVLHEKEIRKHEFRARVGADVSPYDVALEFGIERVFLQLQSRGATSRRTVVVFESRGKREDAELEHAFHDIMARTKMRGMADAFEFRIASKQTNSSGLQIADLVARPIGVHLLRPEQSNRAWDRVVTRMPKSPAGSVSGWGLKIYP